MKEFSLCKGLNHWKQMYYTISQTFCRIHTLTKSYELRKLIPQLCNSCNKKAADLCAMNQTHIHLLINHLPIVGSILGGFVLAFGLWTKSEHTKLAAYNLMILSALGAIIAYLTGEAAEETIEHIQGIVKERIELHANFALVALVSMIILGVASAVGIWIVIKSPSLSQIYAYLMLIVSLISFGLVAQTGYLGGQIRHTELSSTYVSPLLNSEPDKDE